MQLLIPEMPRVDNLLPYLKRIDESREYSNFGALSREWEKRVSNMIGLDDDCAVAATNATIGLTAAILTADVDPVIPWQLPAWTFVATGEALRLAKRTGVFVDVDLDHRSILDYSLGPYIDVLPFGDKARIPDSGSLFPGVIDAAASFHALVKHGLPAPETTVAVVSFHATKIPGAGEGAMMISRDKKWLRRIRRLINFGFDSQRQTSGLGLNGKVSEYTAAVGLASLDLWPQTTARFQQTSQTLRSQFKRYDLGLHRALRESLTNPYLIVDFKTSDSRDQLVLMARKTGMPTRMWWGKGLAEVPAFKHWDRGVLTGTDTLISRTIGLPFHLRATQEYFDALDRLICSSSALAVHSHAHN